MYMHAHLRYAEAMARYGDAEVDIGGRTVRVVYRIGNAGHGPRAVSLNGTALAFEREYNPYRTGAAAVPMAAVCVPLGRGTNTLVVQLG